MLANMKKQARANTIRSYMTPSPHTIGAEQTLDQAHKVMRAHRIRHLPVLHGRKLVGVVTQRDLALIESLPGVVPAEVPVEDAMTTDVYVVAPGALLSAVAMEMAERKLGSAVVMDREEVIGVFTVTDACQVLARMVAPRSPARRQPTRAAARHLRVV
jgi:acetoin utilization protein AcuB